MKTKNLLWISLLTLLLGILPATAQETPAEPAASDTIEPPISMAWMYMSDDQDYNTIPSFWSEIDFADVDVLNVGPAGIQADGTFGLYNTPQTGDLAHRFKWIIATARTQNPDIKIIVSQWWGYGNGIWGRALSALTTDADITKYANSVGDFLSSYLNVSGGVDGYDIDYESNNVSSNTTPIVTMVHAQLERLGIDNNRTFYLTVSPATTSYLEPVVTLLNFVNMQTYSGSYGLTVSDFTDIGLTTQQLLYGICPESNCGTRTVSQVGYIYSRNKLAGIHLWRLNSGNYQYEGEVQQEVYDFLHP